MASFAEVAIGILCRPKLRSHEASNAPPLMHFGSKHNLRYKGELIPINVADKVAVSFSKDCTPQRNNCPDQSSMVDPSFWIDEVGLDYNGLGLQWKQNCKSQTASTPQNVNTISASYGDARSLRADFWKLKKLFISLFMVWLRLFS